MTSSNAHMADAKRWVAQLVETQDRPLKWRKHSFLIADGTHERIKEEFGLRTLGEARDMVGKELRIRATETG